MILEVRNLSHRYGSELALEDVSLDVEAGELVAVLGPSGCGKTTLVQAIAGHIHPTAGRILLRGTDVTDAPPESRHVGVVFQQPALFPHMSVAENVAYGLAANGVESDERAARVETQLDLVGLSERRDASPEELSGGQKRRVELARALAPQPDVLLLDEPLSALDRALRTDLREEIARIQVETGVTTLFVTHDQEDAMALADRLVVMNEGRVAARGVPRTLYRSPPTPFVASFLGRSNAFEATVTDRDPLTVAVGEQELTLTGAATGSPAGSTVTCHVRPADLSLAPADADGDGHTLRGAVIDVTDVGRRYDVTVVPPAGGEIVVETSVNPPTVGETRTVVLSPERTTIFETD